jgi:hypothetical protein
MSNPPSLLVGLYLEQYINRCITTDVQTLPLVKFYLIFLSRRGWRARLELVLCPDPTLKEGKGLVNLDTILGPGKGI